MESLIFVASLAAGVAVILIAILALASWTWSHLNHEPSEALERTSLVGTIGRVQVAIPEDGVGTIALIGTGTRVVMPASSVAHCALPPNAQVIVSDLNGHTAVVELLSLEE